MQILASSLCTQTMTVSFLIVGTTYTKYLQSRFTIRLPTATISLKIGFNPHGMVMLVQAERQRRKIGGTRRREGINITARLILFPSSINSFFRASIGIPVGHISASLAEHFICNHNGTLNLWSISCSPDST